MRLVAACLAILLVAAPVWPAAFDIPHTWTATDPAWRTWINENFDAIETGMNAIIGEWITDGTILNVDIGAAAAIALTKLAESVIQADGGQAFTGSQSFGDFNITNVGNIKVDTLAADATGITVEMTDNQSIGLQIKESSNSYMAFVTTDSGEKITIGKNLDLSAGARTVALYASAADGLNFDSNTVSFDALNNRVGLGTAAPAYTLEVAGDAYVTGATYLGNTSTFFDTNGNLTLASANTIGLGSGKATMTFTDAAVDQIVLTNCVFGVGNTHLCCLLDVGGSLAASSGYGIGEEIDATLVASANNDVLAALYISPTFTDGAYTGVTHYGIFGGGGLYFDTGTFSGALSSYSTVSGTAYTSTIATGTQPYACTSTTKNTNLNADQVDGLSISKFDSGWFSVSGSPQTTITKAHGLGAAATIVQLWFSNTSDGSGDVVLMDACGAGSTGGVFIIENDATNIILETSSSGYVCIYYNQSEAEVDATSGWLKVVALLIN